MNLNKTGHNISFVTMIVCFAFLVYTAFIFYPRWQKSGGEATISWDVSGYYMYLPALFIYKDLKHCNFKDSILKKYGPSSDFQQAFIHPKSGNYVMKYSMGQAITMLPWFIIGHLIARSSHIYPADGFSLPYQMSIGIGMFLYSLLGIYFLRKILLQYFSDCITAIVIAAIVFGTNYLNYAAIDQGMTHSVLFTIYTLLIWATIQFYKKFDLTNAFAIGAFTGLACLIRPTEIICLVIPALWGISRINDIKQRIQLFRHRQLALVVSGFIFISLGLLQIIYWKWVTDEWFVYSYQDQGFYWLRPHFIKYNFSYKSGWLLYCPMMILPFLGIYPLYKYRINFFAITAMISFSWYLVTAWDVWDYGGRAMVQYYPFFAFAFAAFLYWIRGIRVIQLMTLVFMLLSIYLNIWWVYHAHSGNVQVINPSKAYYLQTVGKWNSTEEDYKLLDNTYSFRGTMKNIHTIYENNFDKDSSSNFIIEKGNGMILLNDSLHATTNYKVYNPGNNPKWIRAYTMFYTETKEWDVWQQTQFIITFYDSTNVVQSNLIRIHRFMGDHEYKELYLDAKCPLKWTYLTVDYQNINSTKTTKMDNLKVITFDE